MAGLIDSKFNVKDEIWYVNGNSTTRGIIAKIIYDYRTKQVKYMLRKNDSELYNGYVTESRVFDSEESAKKGVSSRTVIRIERESDLLDAILSYVDLGENVKTPLLIKFCDGWGSDEVCDYFKNKYDTFMVAGHPFKGHKHFVNEKGETELISNHPELTANFFPPSGYDSTKKPLFFMSKRPLDYIWNPDYYLECVDKYKIPFLYFEPSMWGDGQEYSNSPDVITDFETILYAPTVKGWLNDMNENDLPNRKRLIDSVKFDSMLYRLFSKIEEKVHNSELSEEDYKHLKDVYQKILPDLLLERVENLLKYAESIKDLGSYEELATVYFFNNKKPSQDNAAASIPYLFEKFLMPFYYNLFFFRAMYPELNLNEDYYQKIIYVHGGIQHMNNLIGSFIKYIDETNDNWVFNMAKPIPDVVLQKVKDALKDTAV